MIGNFPEVLNSNRLFSNSTGSFVTTGRFSPIVGLQHVVLFFCFVFFFFCMPKGSAQTFTRLGLGRSYHNNPFHPTIKENNIGLDQHWIMTRVHHIDCHVYKDHLSGTPQVPTRTVNVWYKGASIDNGKSMVRPWTWNKTTKVHSTLPFHGGEKFVP